MKDIRHLRSTHMVRPETDARLGRMLLLVLSVALALTPYPRVRILVARLELATPPTHAHHRPADVPTREHQAHPHCLLCVVAASPLPAGADAEPARRASTDAPAQSNPGRLRAPFINPNVGARAPPRGPQLIRTAPV